MIHLQFEDCYELSMVLKAECNWSPTLFGFMAFCFGYCSLINKERLISKSRLINNNAKNHGGLNGRETPGGQAIGQKGVTVNVGQSAGSAPSGKDKSGAKKSAMMRRKSVGAGVYNSTDITIEHLLELLEFCTKEKKNFGGRIAFHELMVNVKSKKYIEVLKSYSKNGSERPLKEQIALPILDLMYLFNIYNLAGRFNNLTDCEPGCEPRIGSISNRSVNQSIKMDLTPIDLIIGIIDEHLKELSDANDELDAKMSKKDLKNNQLNYIINKCYLTFYKGVCFARKKATEAAEACFRIVIANEQTLTNSYVSNGAPYTYSYLVAQSYLELALLDRNHYSNDLRGYLNEKMKRMSISYQDLGKDIKTLVKKTLSFLPHLTTKLIEYRTDEVSLELKSFKRMSMVQRQASVLEPLEG